MTWELGIGIVIGIFIIMVLLVLAFAWVAGPYPNIPRDYDCKEHKKGGK